MQPMSIDWATTWQYALLLFSWLRLFLFLTVVFLNGNLLVRIIKSPQCKCLHGFLLGLIGLGNSFYLTTWLPFIIYGITNGETMVISPNSYCFTQYFITNVLGVSYLTIAALRVVDIVRTAIYSKQSLPPSAAMVILSLAWLLPLIALQYLANDPEPMAPKKSPSFDFIHRTARLDVFCTKERRAQIGVGFLICKENLDTDTLTKLLLQYIALVVPPGTVCIICTITAMVHMKKFKKNSCKACVVFSPAQTDKYDKFDDEDHFSPCSACWPLYLPVMDIILTINVIWHMFLRPLMILHILNIHVKYSSPLMYVDLGSHFVFSISATFAPTAVNYLKRKQQASSSIFSLSTDSFYKQV